jgi:hypothetical protein
VKCASDPTISRVRGTVVSVTGGRSGEETRVCLRDITDAGSTYGNREPREADCRAGMLEGTRPSPGDCVVVQVQGEASYLRVTSSRGC